ncbi:gliding motility lipoprotein GldH [Lutimonas zeaxanthinifaciens]|uniref:gliding motility lipoprotein GldH n=1 Tax=Lutimonas zeaxanthinifaciens TaxID=3060215 RepID=UPI00265CC32C|nr:gliding motility lipoprotein GldH [Lutimonas sp. YSD2104]WKK65880.1 gliding motility lipoprotein GldH [Lutimonas sp. YSD2104]
MRIELKKKETGLVQIILALFFLVSFVSCTKDMVYNQYVPIENGAWHKDSIINFKVSPSDTISKNNLYVTLRNNKDYEFSNLFLIVGIKFPNNYQIVDTLEYEMTTPDGRFLGNGMTDIKENKLEYKTNVTFSMSGDYNVTVQQAMRRTRDIDGLIHLNGITDVGLQIEKLN